MIVNTPEQTEAIRKLRARRARELKDCPMRFPAFEPGMLTTTYVRLFTIMSDQPLPIDMKRLGKRPAPVVIGPEVEDLYEMFG